MLRRLTATEARLARLVASGSSDLLAASKLALDPATIERRLVDIYRKLGVRSRTELALLVGSEQEQETELPANHLGV